MPAAEEPTGVIELAGNDEEGWLQCIVPLLGGDRVVTASSRGKVRVFAVTTGALEHEFDAHKGAIGERALAALGGDIIISGGKNDGTIVTWNTASGDWLGEAAVGDGVIALAALDDRQFVAGTDCGDVMFYKHDRGRGLEEAACVVDAHSDGISDFAVCGGRLATASSDQTATVWSVDSRERVATLSGHTDWVVSVDMNDQLVVTASNDKTVRVYNAERGYSCTAVVGWFHTDWVNSVAIIGDDHILSASHDHNVCVTQISTGLIVARKDLRTPVHCAAALSDGRLAVCGWKASLIDAPAAAADILKAHGTAAFPKASAAASPNAVPEPLPPLQDAVVRVTAGALTAGAASRDLIAADSCSSSLAEWSAGHLLLMTAVRGGEIEASQIDNRFRNYWFDTLYVPSRKLCLGTGDYDVVKRLLEEAKAAGAIEEVEASLAAIASHNDLRVNTDELRSAGQQILRGITHILMRQEDVNQRLCDIENGFERFERVPQWTHLASILFSLVPFTSGTTSCGIAGASSAFGDMQVSNMVESLLCVATGSQAAATAKLFNRFLACGNDLLSEDGFAVISVDAGVLLEKVASELGVSMQRLRQILKKTAQRMVQVRESQGAPDALEACGEDGDEVYDKEDAERSTGSANGNDVDDVGVQFEGATMHERLSALPSGAPVNASTPETACDSSPALGTSLNGTSDKQEVYRKAVTALLGVEAFETASRKFKDDLHVLKQHGVAAEVVSNMTYKELAVSLAARMVEYEQVWLSQFVWLRTRLVERFFEETVSGSLLVGDHAVSASEFLELVVKGLNASDASRPTIGQRVALRRFISSLYGASD